MMNDTMIEMRGCTLESHLFGMTLEVKEENEDGSCLAEFSMTPETRAFFEEVALASEMPLDSVILEFITAHVKKDQEDT